MRKSVKTGVAAEVARQLAPKVTTMAPGATEAFVRHALNRAIVGVGPLPGAAAAADAQLREQHGDVDRAIKEVIENHVRYAGVEGLVTNLGGLVTAAVVAPASISGLALVQCRMVAGIAHLRGYDLDDPRVRNAILVALLGDEVVVKMAKAHRIPGPPMAIATSPAYDATTDPMIANAIAGELIGRVIGKRLAATVGKKMPVVGGAVGMVADAVSTWRVGRYADREFLPR
ncbi:MAG TPA: EcsC family protein [Nocardioides sp.]|nr:EcsC family protein [Nocardioides sp.]